MLDRKAGSRTVAVPPPPSVGVQPVVEKGVSRSFEFVGHIKAVEQVELRARVEGFLDKVLFTEGHIVKAGDLLYQIEKVQFQAELDRAQANVAVDEAELTATQLDYNRAADLAARNFGSQQILEQNRAKLAAAKGKLAQDKAALVQAQTNLDYTDIRAPITGRIGRTAFTKGNLVNPQSGVLATIVSQDPIYVLFPVSVRDINAVRHAREAGSKNGAPAKIDIFVRLSDGAEYPHRGAWDFTDPQVNQQTDSLLIRASLPNPDSLLVDGEFVTVVVRERVEEKRLVVPQSALQVDQTGYYVLIVDAQHRVVQRRVTTGPNDGTGIVVATGLAAGDSVLVEGIQKVRPGQTVHETVVPAAAPR